MPGLIGRYGNIDPTDGGFAHRYSLSARWNETDADGATRVNAYVVKSDLALFNNFTYFLNNPIDGDQFKQSDDRLMAGGSASRTFFGTGPAGLKSETTIGVQTRFDFDPRRALQHQGPCRSSPPCATTRSRSSASACSPSTRCA